MIKLDARGNRMANIVVSKMSAAKTNDHGVIKLNSNITMVINCICMSRNTLAITVTYT